MAQDTKNNTVLVVVLVIVILAVIVGYFLFSRDGTVTTPMPANGAPNSSMGSGGRSAFKLDSHIFGQKLEELFNHKQD